MAGTTGLEPAASAVTVQRRTVLQQLRTARGLPNDAQAAQGYTNCGLDCGLGILRENCPERYLARKVLGLRSAPTTGT